MKINNPSYGGYLNCNFILDLNYRNVMKEMQNFKNNLNGSEYKQKRDV